MNDIYEFIKEVEREQREYRLIEMRRRNEDATRSAMSQVLFACASAQAVSAAVLPDYAEAAHAMGSSMRLQMAGVAALMPGVPLDKLTELAFDKEQTP